MWAERGSSGSFTLSRVKKCLGIGCFEDPSYGPDGDYDDHRESVRNPMKTCYLEAFAIVYVVNDDALEPFVDVFRVRFHDCATRLS